ncbi:MAG: metallophosphoesterase [Ignavibacteriaceae bacterium]
MKIAHISDLHLNTFFKNSSLREIKYLLKYVLSEGIDHLVITGDLVDNADLKDLEILRNLFKRLGLLESDRMSLVIGNHDIFGGPQTPEDIFTFPERCKNVPYENKVKEFGEYFSETFKNCIYKNEDHVFPFVKILDNVMISGFNSIAKYSKLKNPFGSNGEINFKQFQELGDIYRSYSKLVKYKLMLVHHHFNKIKVKEESYATVWRMMEKQTMKLRKKKNIIGLFKYFGADLVLHGHLHEQKEYIRKELRFLNSGASVKNNFADRLFVNFIDLNSDGIIIDKRTIMPKYKTERIIYPLLLEVV